jgi:hypothetical protein
MLVMSFAILVLTALPEVRDVVWNLFMDAFALFE